MLGFGMGEVLQPNIKAYSPVSIPASILAYMNGEYSKPEQSVGRKTLGWTVRWPGGETSTSRETQDFEATIQNVINAAAAAYNNFRPGDATLAAAQAIATDILAFKDYIVLKFQDTRDSATPQATNDFFEIYFGGFTNYKNITNWLSDQAALALQEILDQTSLLVAEGNIKTSSAKNSFYRNKIVPIANNFSKDDQSFLRDVFVLQMDGDTSLSDLLKAIQMLKGFLSLSDLSSISQFGYSMILGPDLSSNVLNPNKNVPYGQRNVANEVSEITAKYQALAARLGTWLDPATNSLFQQRLDIWRSGYSNPNDPKYAICGKVCEQINFNIMSAVTNALGSALGFAPTPLAAGGSKSGVGFLLLGGAALLYLLGRKD